MKVPCPFCGVGCKLDVEKERPVSLACPKGYEAFNFYRKNTVERPLLREGDEFYEVKLEEAAEIASQWIMESKTKYFIGSAEDVNEVAWSLQKLARFLGLNDIDHCGRVCHAPTVEAYKRIFGTTTTPYKLGEEVEDLLVVGSDVSVTYPVHWILLKKSARRVVVVDAWESFTMLQADDRLIVPPGPGFYAFSEIVYSYEFGKEIPRWTREWVDVNEVLELWKSLEKPALVHGMGMTHSGYGYSSIIRLVQAVMKRGGTVATLRGKANVQGAGDMGLNPYLPAPIDTLERAWGFGINPKPGIDMLQAFQAPRDLYYIQCQNVVASLPNAFEVTTILETSKVIHVTPKITETSIFADLIVPSTPLIWSSGTVTSGDGLVTSFTVGENRALTFLRLIGEYLGIEIPKNIKEITYEAFSLVESYSHIDVESLYKGKDQYVKKPKKWKEVPVPKQPIMKVHKEEGVWLYTARDPALWTTKGGTEKMFKSSMKEKAYFWEGFSCNKVRLCSNLTGRCLNFDVETTKRVPKGVVVVFFNHVGLKVNALVPWEPRDWVGTPMYKAVKVKVTCLDG